MIILALITLIVLLLYAYIHLTEKSRQIDRMFSGPFRIPFIGTLPFNVSRVNKVRIGLAQTYNNRPYRLWFVNKPYIMISDYETAKLILTQSKFMDRAESYKAFEALLGRNHFLGTKEVWMKFRKHAMQVFHHKAVNSFLDIFDRNCDTLCRKWQKHVGKEAFNIKDDISMYVMDNVTETFSNEKWHWQTHPNPPLVKAMEEISKIFRWRTVIPILSVDWIFNLTPWGRVQKEAIKISRDHSEKLLKSKQESIRRQQELNGGQIIENEESVQDPLTQFIMTNEFTDEEIRSEIESVVFAGWESSTTLINFTLYSLAKHPNIQDKVYNEIKTVMGKSDAWPNLNDLNKMVYTEQVLCETLRCYPPFSAIGRFIKEDLPLSKHQFIPKNTNVFISLSGIHKDPTNWPNPTVFDPNRFSPENVENRDPYAFVPFSAGPGKCSGYKFAMAQVKLTVAKVIQQFKLSLSGKSEDEVRPVRNMGLVITSINGFNIKLQSRDDI